MIGPFSPTCFSAPDAEPTTSNSKNMNKSQNLITCIYHLQQQDGSSGGGQQNHPSLLTLTWSKTLLGHSLTVHLDGSAFTIDISPPSPLRLFRPKRGSKPLAHANLFWSFARARFDHGPEPTRNFYLCVVTAGRAALLLGDMPDEALRHAEVADLPDPSPSALVSRREHVFGRRNYATTARFGGTGREHEIGIECSGGEGKEAKLVVRVDGKSVLAVKKLAWKFRGNQRVVVDGSTVEIFWDVYNWLFNGGGHAVFIFQAGGGSGGGVALGGVWPELVVKGPEKKLLRKSVSSRSTESASSVLQWAGSFSESSNQSWGSPNSGFSLLLYAWRSDKK
ncbi:uncharacterized protein LOC116250958 [Nymphaea colorata]|uniref:DUF868 domain-containing protein n=1 Tax=Nymphaea colorata TaxID=210225 RepID=A0A5K0VJW6_9MAGN|nr:uncharacterized protein LOC116250958 [Nymphaea colorata]